MMSKVSILLILCIIVAITLCYHCQDVLADVNQLDDGDAITNLEKYEIIINNQYENSSYVSRLDCIILIMRAVGIDSETAEWHKDTLYSVPLFQEYNYFENIGYLYFAGETGVAIGRYNENDKKKGPYLKSSLRAFDPYTDVTIMEAITFIIRCLDYDFCHKEDGTGQTLESIYKKAEAIGLVNENEFGDRLDEYISYEELCILINRMLYQPSRLYYDIDINGRVTRIDENKGFTYIELLTARLNKDKGTV